MTSSGFKMPARFQLMPDEFQINGSQVRRIGWAAFPVGVLDFSTVAGSRSLGSCYATTLGQQQSINAFVVDKRPGRKQPLLQWRINSWYGAGQC